MKMKKLYLYLFLTVFLLAGCGRDPATVKPASVESDHAIACDVTSGREDIVKIGEDQIPSGDGSPSVAGPLCILGTPGNTTVRWFGEKGDYSLIFEAESQLYLASPKESHVEDEYAYSVSLPLTKFRYKVTDGNCTTDWYSCRGRAEAEPFAFTFLGDPQLVGKTSTAAFRDSLKYFSDSSFALVAGDIVNSHDEIWQYEAGANGCGEGGLAVASSLGNHDDPELFDFFFGTEGMTRSGGDYAFHIGNTLFLCFDSNDPDMGNRSAFVQEAIGDTPWDWVIAYMHHAIFSPLNKLDYDAETRRETFIQLFSSYDFDLILSGDDHFYARSYVMQGEEQTDLPTDAAEKSNGQTLYLTAGSSSGSKYYELKKGLPDYICAAGEPEQIVAVQVSVSSDMLQIQSVYTESGEVFDTFTLTRGEKRVPVPSPEKEPDMMQTEEKIASDDPVELAAARILRSQLPNGAIAMYPVQEGGNWVNPYFADYAAMALLRCGEYEAVQKYILWHISRLNAAQYDINGMAYTIFDYNISVQDGKQTDQTSTMDYDSVDSYAASFLLLLNEYQKATGDTALICENEAFIGGVIQVLDRVYTDGLTVARPDYPICYLMDNCEVALALEAASELIDTVVALKKQDSQSWPALKETCLEHREKIMERIPEFWDASANAYAYAMSTDGTLSLPEDRAFYPDAISQLSPVIFGVLSPKEPEAEECYRVFCQQWSWENFEPMRSGISNHIWAMSACAAAMMDDDSRVEQFMQNYVAYEASEESNLIGVNEAAWVILAATGGL